MTHVGAQRQPLQQLEELVPLCGSIRRGKEYLEALAQAADEVRKEADLPDKLKALMPALLALKGVAQLAPGDLAADVDKLLKAGQRLKQCVNTEALKDARFAVRDAKEAWQRVETLVSRAWARRVQEEFSPLETLGAVLAGIPDTKAAGVALQAWAKRALATSAGAPTTESVKKFTKAQAEHPGQLAALGRIGIDSAVQAFLIEVAGDKATLASMTPEVLVWLHAKKAQSRFRVKLT